MSANDLEPEAPKDDASDRPHELATFMRQDAAEMQSEYERIRSVSSEDPGTAGDEGEETWAKLLRDWLPETYQVVTKGRLLAADGARGPQVDLIVLRPGYPRRLINKKLYLVGGVAAAFECKNTLKAEHVERSFEQVQKINALSSERVPTPFTEAVPEVFFGVLGHSTIWQSSPEVQRVKIDGLLQAGLDGMANMRDSPGLFCVADLACWSMFRMVYDGPWLMPPDVWEARRAQTGLPPEGAAHVSYMRYVEGVMATKHAPFNALSAAIASLVGRLAHGDASVRPLSQYFFAAGLQGSGTGTATRGFPLEAFPQEVRSRLPSALTSGIVGSDWSMAYLF